MPLPHSFSAGDLTVTVRQARADDVPAIVDLIAADQLGVTRDGIRSEADGAAYLAAFQAIDADAGEVLVVAEYDGQVIGTLQLSLIPGLARRGSLRAQLEAVRVCEDLRGRGIGAALLAWAIDEARGRGCALVQLTSDKTRADSHRLYSRLGFTASHEGFKLRL
ncbi:MAG: GNAT family N-acetyltransferase [Kineosporiaceae bacterium]|nr:GNAT family N-acetyltransferase [Kineosporiaceae bacterium]MBK7624793.1 GNAT family N-acetyltransferase [Kineosporiaceae bacterium]MBK8076830.1 GNAT family N-acetyltransferase [Kineosporiaceae bacterium]